MQKNDCQDIEPAGTACHRCGGEDVEPGDELCYDCIATLKHDQRCQMHQRSQRYLGIQTCSQRCWFCKMTAWLIWSMAVAAVAVFLVTLVAVALQ